MKKFTTFVLISLILLSTVACGSKTAIKHPYTQEYAPGQGNIQGNVDVAYFIDKDERFDIGADKNGMAVFKDPDKAFQALLENYASGIALIKKENNLADLSPKNYEDYKTYGWQMTSGSEEEQKEAGFVSQFLDIYENSFD